MTNDLVDLLMYWKSMRLQIESVSPTSSSFSSSPASSSSTRASVVREKGKGRSEKWPAFPVYTY